MLPGSIIAGTQNHIHAPCIGHAIKAAAPKKPPKNKVNEVPPPRLSELKRWNILLPAVKSHIKLNKTNQIQCVKSVIDVLRYFLVGHQLYDCPKKKGGNLIITLFSFFGCCRQILWLAHIADTLVALINKMSKILFFTSLFVVSTGVILAMFFYGRSIWCPMYQKIVRKQTLEDVVKIYGDPARSRLMPFFKLAGVSYPPEKITLLAIKDNAKLELWAENPAEKKHIRTYKIKALNGTSGPKLNEGDKQVPEGFYEIEGLNPNSSYHLSMKLNYPNAFDQQHATAENRTHPGTNIFIHGKAVSIGCLAMGDSAIEELFILAADVGKSNISVAIAPSDPRLKPLPINLSPQWVSTLYQQLTEYFSKFKTYDS